MSALFAFLFSFAMTVEGLKAGPSAEYVVYPRILESRGMNGEKLLHINEKLTLRLEKISVLPRNFVVSSLYGAKQVDKVVDGREVEKNIYHDQSQMAAVSVTEKDGNVEVSGSLGHTLRIAPLPLMGRSTDGHIAHKVFEIEEPKEFKTDYIGVAYLGGLCTIHLRVAQSEDRPHTHSMVPTLVHELGHSLGMVHDGDKPVYSTPGNEYRICSASDGFTMAPVANGPRNGQWSRCSLDHVRAFVRTLQKACFDLLSLNHYTINMTVLPGERITKLDLCKRTFPGFAGMSVHSKSQNSRECYTWCCPQGYRSCLKAPLTDGMDCIYGYYCVKHQCVRKSKG
uniref:Putative secreted metalloprotease n=1 Tax=Ixodes ricinus TaxID=34613 RepID=A0A147BXU4_IXORI